MNLIVGGTGFIGGHLAEYFFREGEISKGTFRKGSFLRIMDQCGIQCLEADPLDRNSLHEAMDMTNVVYNLASPTPDHEGQGEGERDYLTMNTKGLLNLLEEADEHGVKDFVHLSTLDVFGFRKKRVGADATVASLPLHPYQAAKLQAERVVLEYSKRSKAERADGEGGGEMRVKIVRAAKAIGSRDTTLALSLLRMMESRKMVLPSGSESPMSFTHPKDVAKALFMVATSGVEGRTYQVKSFDASVDQLATALMEASVKKSPIKHEGLFAKTLIPPYTSSQVKAGLVLETQESWSPTGFSPEYDLQKTAQEITEWHGKEPWLTENERE